MADNIPNDNYVFPHVRFSEKTVGPQPSSREFRSTIGIVAPFSRGPAEARFSTRSEFVSLYGEDSSAGGLAVQQAFLQNATDFYVSRVMPSAKAGKGGVSLVPASNVTTLEAVVGNNSDEAEEGRTTGLRFSLGYVSSPYAEVGKNIGAIVQTPIKDSTDSNLIPFYDATADSFVLNGKGSMLFHVKEVVQHEDLWDDGGSQSINTGSEVSVDAAAESPTLTAIGSLTTDNIYLLDLVRSEIASDAELDNLLATAKPGLDLASSGSADFEIISYPWEEAGTVYLFVKAKSDFTYDPAGTPEALYVTTPNDSAPPANFFHYVISTKLSSPEIDTLSSDFYISNESEVEGGGAFFNRRVKEMRHDLVVSKGDTSIQKTYLLRSTGTVGEYELFDTGVHVQFGFLPTNTVITSQLNGGQFETLDSDFVLNVGTIFSCDFFSISVGEGASSDDTETDAFEKGLTASEILQNLEDEVLSNPYASEVIRDMETQSFTLPITLSFESVIEGLEASRINYRLDRFISSSANDNTIDDIDFTVNATSALGNWLQIAGADNGMTKARRIFYDRAGNPLVLVEALTPGSSGNDIEVTLNSFAKGQFTLNVSYSNPLSQTYELPPETFTLNNRNTDPNSGIYKQTLDSRLVRVYFLPVVKSSVSDIVKDSEYDAIPVRVSPPIREVSNAADTRHPAYVGVKYTSNLKLRRGYTPKNYLDGNIPAADYEEALERLKSEDVAIIALVGFDLSQSQYDSVVSAALDQANSATAFNGLRTVAVAAPRRLSKRLATNIGEKFSDDRLSIVAGWSSFVGNSALGLNATNPVGYYVGKLMSSSPHISPAATGEVNGVLSVDIKSRPDFLDHLTRAGIDAIYFDNSSNTNKILNGRTTSTNGVEKWVALRRIGDHIITNLYNNLRWARSLPNSPETRRRVASSADAFMQQLVANGQILTFVPSVVDASNNTSEDVRQGILNIRITYTPFLPADVIDVTLVRDVTQLITIE